jgi:hypothetical protein
VLPFTEMGTGSFAIQIMADAYEDQRAGRVDYVPALVFDLIIKTRDERTALRVDLGDLVKSQQRR